MNFIDYKKSTSTLSHDQMKTIKGGTGTCGYMGPIIDGQRDIICNISKSEAMFYMSAYLEDDNDAYWCCDSCASTSYCG
ncbi:MAG: rSAM-modified peptide [Bacteroidetes bacterium HGW-Bacteroidetes-6]|nr:MAG: rSAM-modified peptide [Bacteroidetes bacterium HGW-Bacteroidetes-7]PKP04839.1 MAG: rSAM-modified peptide [Bacteroidetes bacterium HGW-Bacteroidetes-6]